MTPECRQILKRDAFELLASHDESCKALNEQGAACHGFPFGSQPQAFRRSARISRGSERPVRLNNTLIGNRSYCTETIFSIVDAGQTGASGRLHAGKQSQASKDRQHILALGVRYNGLAKRLNVKNDIQGVGFRSSSKATARACATP